MDKIICKTKDAFGDIIRDRKSLAKILSIILILLVALFLKIHDSSEADIRIESSGEAAGQTASAEEESEETEEDGIPDGGQVIFVDIGGAVISPGVYQVARDTRLYEVIEMAGGLAENADTDSVNQASYVEDGQKIIIPVKGEERSSDLSSSGITPSGSGAEENGLVNINTASAEELKTLNGIGDVTAQKIIEYRSSNTFRNKEDIMSVNGIGNGIYQKIKDRITC